MVDSRCKKDIKGIYYWMFFPEKEIIVYFLHKINFKGQANSP